MTLETVQPSSSHYSTAPATILQRIVQSTTSPKTSAAPQELRLLFLGCESQPPYGPYEHTATLFLDLICRALETTTMEDRAYHVMIDVYHVSKHHFPPHDALDDYQGVILPGSFNSAYDSEPWIIELSKLIQEELVTKQRPTLGVCFGHQLYAHSFPDGGAIKCPAGPQAGRKISKLTPMGQQWLHGNNSSTDNLTTTGLQLYYTHGDMVEKLPPQGHCLGGTQEVPIQAAIYLSSTDQKPIAITFQAHPEYAASRSLGLQGTLNPIMKAMNDRKDISDQELERATEDASKEFEAVEAHSIQTMITVGRLLGWFPPVDQQNSQETPHTK